MSWKRLTIEDLRLTLAEDEIDKLQNASVELSGVIQTQLDTVADAYRGAFLAKGYTIDSHEHYIPSSYAMFVLNYARWQIWTRFPMTEDYALSEPREKQYEEAAELLKNPYIGVDPVDPVTPVDPDDPPDYVKTDAAITLPFQRFPAFPMSEGFWQVYVWPLIANKNK